MSKQLDEWRRKKMENSMTDPDEAWAAIKKSIDPNAPLYRLELLYDENEKLVILQGNQVGLENLLHALLTLVKPDTPAGAHAHFDRASGLSKNDLDLIIQRVGDDDMGITHTVDASRD
jgi:hypothetical protein